MIAGLQLVRLLEQREDQEVWLCVSQKTLQKVDLTIAKTTDVARFIADAKAKTTVTHAAFATVQEPFQEDGVAAYSSEHLAGKTIAELAESGAALKPLELSQLLNDIAVALRSLRVDGVYNAALWPTDIVWDNAGRLRLRNVAVCKERKPDRKAREESVAAFRALLEPRLPGSTRMTGLLDLMEGSSIRPPMGLREIEQLSLRVSNELSSDHLTAAVARPVNEAKHKRMNVMMAALVVVTLGIIAVPFTFQIEHVEPRKKKTVLIPQGRYPTPEGGMIDLKEFHLAVTEVTIRDYADFLGAWGMMTDAERALILPVELLGSSWTPLPEGWKTYYPIALDEGEWDGRRFTIDCPVVGVDWWDATAYAIWKGARLPTRQDWWAACYQLPPKAKRPARWGPVGGPGDGPHDLCGNVSEWARDRAYDPEEAQLPAQFSILGGSFQTAEQDPLRLERVGSPSFTRPDVGFRLVYDVEQ